MKEDSEDFFLRTAFQGCLPESIEGNVGWQSPSNIALVKYWGKHGKQLPNNPSISLTLSEAHTKTSVHYKWKKDDSIQLNFNFEGVPYPLFGQKIEGFLKTLLPFFPFLSQLELHVDSSNTFPHSSGIASSASSMSALVLCLLDMEQSFTGQKLNVEDFLRKASYFSRIGSGSASRSVFPFAAVWGETKAVSGSSQEFAVPAEALLHPVFQTMRDSILIVHSGTKSVSSRAGHALMENNPFAATRYAMANQNLKDLLRALSTGDLDEFIRITEEEAMQLHALMMTSRPSYLLMQPETLSVIQSVRRFRNDKSIPLCFTLDAGPNVHLLYPARFTAEVTRFLEDELLGYCAGRRWIDDAVGSGHLRLTR